MGWDNTITFNIPCSLWNEDDESSTPALIRSMWIDGNNLIAYVSDSTGSHEYRVTLVSKDTVALDAMIPE